MGVTLVQYLTHNYGKPCSNSSSSRSVFFAPQCAPVVSRPASASGCRSAARSPPNSMVLMEELMQEEQEEQEEEEEQEQEEQEEQEEQFELATPRGPLNALDPQELRNLLNVKLEYNADRLYGLLTQLMQQFSAQGRTIAELKQEVKQVRGESKEMIENFKALQRRQRANEKHWQDYIQMRLAMNADEPESPTRAESSFYFQGPPKRLKRRSTSSSVGAEPSPEPDADAGNEATESPRPTGNGAFARIAAAALHASRSRRFAHAGWSGGTHASDESFDADDAAGGGRGGAPPEENPMLKQMKEEARLVRGMQDSIRDLRKDVDALFSLLDLDSQKAAKMGQMEVLPSPRCGDRISPQRPQLSATTLHF